MRRFRHVVVFGVIFRDAEVVEAVFDGQSVDDIKKVPIVKVGIGKREERSAHDALARGLSSGLEDVFGEPFVSKTVFRTFNKGVVDARAFLTHPELLHFDRATFLNRVVTINLSLENRDSNSPNNPIARPAAI